MTRWLGALERDCGKSKTTWPVATVTLWMTGALIAFCATAVSIRMLSQSFGVSEMLSLRNLAGLLIVFAAILAQNGNLRALLPINPALHLGRNAVQLMGTYGWTYGLIMLPLATVFACEFTTPIWVGVLASLFLRERLTRARVAALTLGFCGILVILQPGASVVEPASVIVLISAIAFALSTIATKKLTETQSTLTILFWMNLIQFPFNAAFSEDFLWEKIDHSNILHVVGLCVGGLASQFCLTNAYRHGDVMLIAPLDFLRVPLIALVGWYLFGETVNCSLFVGFVCIVIGIVWSLQAERLKGSGA